MDSSSSAKTRSRLTQAAAQGIVTGLALLGCQTTTDRASVNAPMEASSAAASPSSTVSPPATQARNPIVPIVPRIVSADRDRDCCNGKNECKGKSGCSSNAADGVSCGFGHDCKGKNECKGKGTACDFSDDAANLQPASPPPPRPRIRRP
jgi:hypothetical protein